MVEESRWCGRRWTYDATSVRTQRIVSNNIAGWDPTIGADTTTKFR